MNIDFLELTDQDFPWVKLIYDYYIKNSTATYYTDEISISELKDFIPVGHPKYHAYLVRVDNERVGFCYVGQYKKRQAYHRTAEVSLYLKSDFTGKGIGKEILAFLEKDAKKSGISVLIGIISGDNTNSIKLFERSSYEKCAHYKQVGEKFNTILDVVAYQKIL